MVPYRSLSALIDGMIQPDTVQGCTLFYAAQGFDVSFQEIYSTLCCGHTLHLIEDDIKKDLHILYRTLRQAGHPVVPAHFHAHPFHDV